MKKKSLDGGFNLNLPFRWSRLLVYGWHRTSELNKTKTCANKKSGAMRSTERNTIDRQINRLAVKRLDLVTSASERIWEFINVLN